MTPRQRHQFNTMRVVLKQIALGYHTPSQLSKAAERAYNLSYIEALEFAYENIQQDAKDAVKGVREAKQRRTTGEQDA